MQGIEAAGSNGTHGKNGRSQLLLVDDEPQVLVALEDLLAGDYDVMTADSPERALDVLRAERDIAVVMTDQRMPGMTGDEMLSHLNGSCDATRVLITGYAELSAVIRAVNLGHIFAYVTKPWNGAELRMTVQKCVERFDLLRELERERQLLDDLMNNIPDAIYFKDRDLAFTRVNRAFAERFGLASAREAVGKRLLELGVAPELVEQLEADEARVVQHGQAAIDLIREREIPGGRRFYSTTLGPVRGHGDVTQGLVGVSRDVTARLEIERTLRRLTHVRTMLGAINGAIVRIKERDALLRECCRIAVDAGELLAACILHADPERGDLSVVASSGGDDGTTGALEAAVGSEGPDPLRVSEAVREAGPQVVNDLWDDEAVTGLLGSGARAAATLPLIVDGRVLGCFVLVGRQRDTFDGEEMKVLLEVTSNIAFALDHLEKRARLDFLAYYDELTGLPKRNLLFDRLHQLVHGRGVDGAKVAVLLVDVSRLRQVNDTLGRGGGDELLVQVARRLSGRLGERDTLARLEGSSFAMLLCSPGDASDLATWVDESVFATLNAPFSVRDTELRVTARVGIAVFPSDGLDADALLRDADAALAKARTSGQRYLFYAPSMNERVGEKLSLETRLRRALEEEEFVLHYQPKVELKSGMVVGLEALIRWQDPDRGLVSPGQFIPVLEETGLIVDVGDWVLRSAARQCESWLEAGLTPPRIAVNVSALQLGQAGFMRSVERSFELFPAAREGLDVEITESVLMDDLTGNIEKLRELRARGVRIAIDDFGTGYSSLGYLSRLPIDALKIDRSFVIRMSDDPQDMTIVTTIISLAHSLDLKVIAEGVETGEQARLLRLVKCDQIQGYLIGKPKDAGETATLFRAKARSWPPPAE
jgi:diguanylate cyclase (GGDEF)-like protein/PAS domain S-box-containing protein